MQTRRVCRGVRQNENIEVTNGKIWTCILTCRLGCDSDKIFEWGRGDNLKFCAWEEISDFDKIPKFVQPFV